MNRKKPKPLHRDRKRLRRLRNDSRTRDVHLFRDAFLRLSRARDLARRASEIGESAELLVLQIAKHAKLPATVRNSPTDLSAAATLLQTLTALLAEDIRIAEKNLLDLLRKTDTPPA